MEGILEKNKTLSLVRIGLFIALSGVGAYLKFPSPVGSIALDSLPGYVGVLLLGIKPGSIILAIGHMVSALTAGFPLGIMHLIIAVGMAGCGLVFGYLAKKNIILAVIITVICNGILVPGLLIPVMGKGFFMGLVPMLLLASGANILLAVLVNQFIARSN
ncbi:ECF transporter S component [Halanaerobaculum tunisiense]